MSMRISNGAVIDLSLFAYIPTIRAQLPDTPEVLMVELLIYSIAVTFHFTLIQSYLVSGEDPNTYVMKWNEDVWFLLSMAVTLLSVVILLILGLLHKLKWEPMYLSGDEDLPD